MKKLLILSLLVLNCYSNADELKISGKPYGDIHLLCINGIEYIEDRYLSINQGGISLVLSVDKNGKPKQCNY